MIFSSSRSLEHSEIWRRGFRGPEHINCKEVRAYIIEEGHIARRGARLRTLSGLDSQVALGALVKGRSASGSLNELLEGSLGAYLGCGMYPHFLYFLSELNPSDGPTRGRDPPKASGPLPDWWCSLLAGNYDEFDSWMMKVGATRAGFSFEHLARPLKSEHPLKQVEASSSRDRLGRGEAPLAQGAGLDATAVPAPADDERLGFPLKQFRWKGDGPDTAARGALDLFAGTGGAGRALLKLGAPLGSPFRRRAEPRSKLVGSGPPPAHREDDRGWPGCCCVHGPALQLFLPGYYAAHPQCFFSSWFALVEGSHAGQCLGR